MKELYIAIPEETKEFIRDIQNNLKGIFEVYLGGGTLRDLYCNKEIKDTDIFFIPCDGVAKNISYIPAKCYINYNKSTADLTDTSDMKERGVRQVVGLFNSKLTPCDIQFIVYDKKLTALDLAEDLDMGINQIVWSATEDKITYSPNFIDGHSDRVIECLHNYDEVRQYHRYQRMLNKFPDYTTVGMPSESVLPLQEQISIQQGHLKLLEQGHSWEMKMVSNWIDKSKVFSRQEAYLLYAPIDSERLGWALVLCIFILGLVWIT